MSSKVEIAPAAEKDLDWFREHDRSLYLKCFDLALAIAQDPYQGIGKPEPLKHVGPGVWSRRVSLEHRLVYRVGEEIVVIVAYHGHYD
jgi:toxin YoeB